MIIKTVKGWIGNVSFYAASVGLINWLIVGLFGVDFIQFFCLDVFRSEGLLRFVYIWIGGTGLEMLYKKKLQALLKK